MSGMCQYDRDCPGSLACYTNVSWYVPQPGENGCLCSSYYGFSGPDCQQVLQTHTSRVWIGLGIIIIALQVWVFVMSMVQIGSMFRHKMVSLRAEFVGTVQLWIGSVFGIVAQIGFIWASHAPNDAQFIRGDSTKDKENTFHSGWQAFYAISAVVQLSAALTIALLWIDLAGKAARLTQLRSHGMALYQKWLAAFEITFLLLYIIPIALGYQSISVALAYLLQVTIIVTYIRGYFLMTRVIYSIASSNSGGAPVSPSVRVSKGDKPKVPAGSDYSRTLREMRYTTVIICTLVFLAAICSTVVFATMVVGWKEVSWVNPSISLQVVFFLLMVLSVTLAAVWVLVFLKHCTDRLVKREATERQLVPVTNSDGKGTSTA